MLIVWYFLFVSFSKNKNSAPQNKAPYLSTKLLNPQLIFVFRMFYSAWFNSSKNTVLFPATFLRRAVLSHLNWNLRCLFWGERDGVVDVAEGKSRAKNK